MFNVALKRVLKVLSLSYLVTKLTINIKPWVTYFIIFNNVYVCCSLLFQTHFLLHREFNFILYY